MALVLPFVLGVVGVLLFSAAGECFEPETFGGLFGASPSVAIATLAVAFAQLGAQRAASDARWMLLGCVAMLAYTTVCVAVCRERRIPVAVGAFGAWRCAPTAPTTRLVVAAALREVCA